MNTKMYTCAHVLSEFIFVLIGKLILIFWPHPARGVVACRRLVVIRFGVPENGSVVTTPAWTSSSTKPIDLMSSIWR